MPEEALSLEKAMQIMLLIAVILHLKVDVTRLKDGVAKLGVVIMSWVVSQWHMKCFCAFNE